MMSSFRKYSPTQPRVPPGRPRGGQWTDSTTLQNLEETIFGQSLADRPQITTPIWVSQQNAMFRNYIANAEQPNVQNQLNYGYSNINKNGGVALGRYQFRNQGLQDLGLKNNRGKWRSNTKFYNTYHITTDGEFLRNPRAQEDAMSAYLALKEAATRRLAANFLNYRYRGISGSTITITQAGLIAASHRAGEGALARYLSFLHGRHNTFGLTASQLGGRVRYGAEIETRLREAQTIPYSFNSWPATIPNPHPARLRISLIPKGR